MLDLHENRTEDGKRHAKLALEMSKRYHSPNHCFLLSKLKYVESALARREGNYEKAKNLLDDSVEVRGRMKYCVHLFMPTNANTDRLTD